MSKPSGSLTGLGLRNKAGGLMGKKDAPSSSSSSKPSGSISGLGLRNKAGGLMGKAKGGSSETESYQSRPLATLKDPSSFGPPPKNVNYHGGVTSPNQITPDNRGLGAPLSREEVLARRRAEDEEAQREEEEAERARAPRGPFRIDTTGLSTNHLPPPPGRRDGADGRLAILPPPSSTTKSKPPSLPPRLPPRTNSIPSTPPPQYSSEPDAHKGILNQGALGRLGAAGVSVPGFGIESRQPPPNPPSRSPATNSNPQLGELQSRFSKLSTSNSPQTDSPSTTGTTWAQKQAALKTASSFRNDPSSVSLSDARAAASTANNFREQHGEQVKSGYATANKLNTKYGIVDKVGSYGSRDSPQIPESSNSMIEMRDNTTSPVGLGKKKPPPPPPAKKANLAGAGISKGPGPPPIPLNTKPSVSSYHS